MISAIATILKRWLCFPHRYHCDRWLSLGGDMWLEQTCCRCLKTRQTVTRLK